MAGLRPSKGIVSVPHRSNGLRQPGFLTTRPGEATMTVYSGPVFDMAVNQFGVIANHL